MLEYYWDDDDDDVALVLVMVLYFRNGYSLMCEIVNVAFLNWLMLRPMMYLRVNLLLLLKLDYLNYECLYSILF